MARTGAEELQIVVFALGAEEYGVPVGSVQEIIRMTAVTKVPKAPSFMEGVINLRGRVIPIVDLRKLFDLPETARDDKSRIVVVEVDGHTVGMTVDNVSEVLRISADQIDPPPQVGEGQYFTGVGKLEGRLLMLLDLDKLLPGVVLSETDFCAAATANA